MFKALAALNSRTLLSRCVDGTDELLSMLSKRPINQAFVLVTEIETNAKFCIGSKNEKRRHNKDVAFTSVQASV